MPLLLTSVFGSDCLPRETYLEIFEGDTASVNAHLAVLAHIRGNLDARANYIKRLTVDKLNEVLEIIMKGI